MGKKNKKNKRRRTDEDYPTENGLDDDGVVGENSIIPNGFTIDLDDFDVDHGAAAITARRKKKHTRNNDNDEDDEEDSTQQAPRGGYGSQVLPFANNLPDDHTGEPLDGHEYLFLVRREAASHPSVKTAEAFIRRVEEEIVMDITEASTSSALPAHRPSVEWRTSFLSRFSNMRQVMATSSTQPSSSDIPPHYLPIPAAQDESSWRTYINGRKGKGRAVKETNEAIQSASTDAAMGIDDPTSHNADEAHNGNEQKEEVAMTSASGAEASVAPQETAPVKKPVWTEPRPPMPTLMRALDHYTIISLLEHYESWLSERLEDISNAYKPSTVFLPPSMMRKKKKAVQISTTPEASNIISKPEVMEPIIPTTPLVLTPLDSQWIFSLLTVLDPLLSSGEISILRGLARTCQDIANFTWNEQQKWLTKGAASSDLTKYTESIGGCWMINAAIWEIWGQRDLWE